MKMKFSLRRQMTIVFIGLLVFILGAVFIVNTGFLGQYYISHKVQDLLDTYDVVEHRDSVSGGKDQYRYGGSQQQCGNAVVHG